jgi:hypothetical protein
LLLGGFCGSILGLVLEGVEVIAARRYILNLLFTAIILWCFHHRFFYCQFRKTEKLGKLFLIVWSFFIYGIGFGHLDACRRFVFPIQQDFILSQVPMEMVETGTAGSR